MHQNYTSRASLCCLLFTFLFFTNSGHTQVVAGIRANGKIANHGDTINVCKGGTVVYQSAATGSFNVTWLFNGGLPGAGAGILPITVTYNNIGYDTTFQKVTGGAFSDSTFIIVRVADIFPVAVFSFS